MAGDLSDVLKKVVEGLHPDLRAYFRPSLIGRVEAAYAEDYRVDVIVGGDGSNENPGLALPKVPVASLFAQEGYGIWCLPEVDAEVTVSFYEGDVTQPYVEAPRWDKNGSPQGFTTGTIAIVGKAGQKVEFKPGANEIIVSTASGKHITTDTKQERSTGDERKRVVGNRTTQVDARDTLLANESTTVVERTVYLEAGKLTEVVGGDASLTTGGSRLERIGGSISRNVAGGVDASVTLSKREVVGAPTRCW